MLDTARQSAPLFAVIGVCEAVSTVLLFTASAHLPGATLPVLSQSLLLWNFLLSALVLRRRFAATELVGAALVVAGVAFVTLGDRAVGVATAVDPAYSALFVAAMALPAVSSILKERIFKRGHALAGVPLDVFVVNTCGSWAQALCTALLLPVLAAQRGLQLEQLPEYLHQGALAFIGHGADPAQPPWLVFLPCIYLASNLLFNVCALASLRAAGAATAIVSMTAVVPLTIWAFTFDLPLLGAAPRLGGNFVAGAALLLAGLAAYHSAKFRRAPAVEAPM